MQPATEQYHNEKMIAELRDLATSLLNILPEVKSICELILNERGKQVVEQEAKASDAIDWNVEKVVWEERKFSDKPQTWYADSEKNKDNRDFKRMWEAMKKAREAKGNLEPFYFWIKGKQFMWFDQAGYGIYRRQKK